ncbi:hypothetical protein D3C76_1561630 [compost metagenome]
MQAFFVCANHPPTGLNIVLKSNILVEILRKLVLPLATKQQPKQNSGFSRT